ncbi:glycosyltransferase [Paraflavitalea soli]|uniref:Glycosyltransferase n=1 Tax=Paraflavitalea soli TaxID=2315862 RepID=A0A3B7MSI9_9BACT|nr:glycosyltransferase family 4 protein [Paraflavitalea soli]AXY77098.1 glycosyltransferase [Paraflavitalea soli]
MANKKVTHIIVNNLGGITSLISNLIRCKGEDALPQEVLLLNIKGNTNAPSQVDQDKDIVVKQFSLYPRHNWYHVYRKLAETIGDESGVLVSNDVYELLMLSHYKIPRQVVQIVHDGYNVRLSLQYEEVIDAFICHSRFFYEILCQLLPHRRGDIHHIAYGIPLSGEPRTSRLHHDPLRLVFLGRHDVNKGVFDLHAIHELLQHKGIPVDWLILGKGPETEKLQEQWKGEKGVRFYTPPSYDEVLQLLSTRDIFVFPTRFEGFPVALTETMSMGCVPIVTDLPGGIREIVRPGDTGYLCSQENNNDFADHIARLHQDRNKLEQLSVQARHVIYEGYNARIQSPRYQALFNELAARKELPRHHAVRRKIGSRLDQPWIPNTITKYFRRAF